ncbi:hypothetical protein Vadar_017648 [Vaccinium darrowii]|uniref:Uncharacterized protein n=1 Tax=Vaccinium darrowii TaxID=229202 RepID=A0ACB7YWM9_9ERIC|nr:hypothetical protein Vadar_017648 [Vaccinium darrowii]
MTDSGYNVDDLVREAQTRWLKPAEVLFILHNYKEDQLTHQPLQKPASGSLFLLNKRVLRFFRKDGHNWRKKKDGRTVGEAHERLKVGNVEALSCYYAHGEQNPNFQRRSYWMLDAAYEHIVLVHYRDIREGRHSSGSVSQLSPGSTSAFNQSPSALTAQHPAYVSVIERYEPYQSPGAVEVSTDAVVKNNGIDSLDRVAGLAQSSSSSELEGSQALRRLEEQLSSNDDSLDAMKNDLDLIQIGQSRYVAYPDDENDLLLQQETGGNGEYNHQPMVQEFTVEQKDSLPRKEMRECSPRSELQEKNTHTSDGNGMLAPQSSSGLPEEQESLWIDIGRHDSPNCNSIISPRSDRNLQPSSSSEYPTNSGSLLELSTSISLSQEVEHFKYPAHSPLTNFLCTNPYQFTTPFDQDQIGIYLEADSSLTISQKQKFTIREISPEWGFSTLATKVIIVGSFLCNPSELTWTCMFGDIEVPVQIIQEGVICCQAPPHPPGKVTLCITSANRESCSEVREFEYHDSPSSCDHCSSSQAETAKSPEEMLLLVRFVQMLLSDSLGQKGDVNESTRDLLGKSRAGEDLWGHVIETLVDGSWTSSGTVDWLLEELLKDKLQQWLSFRSLCGEQGCSLSKKEQWVIHIVAGLGFEWALNPILSSGVVVDLRDINGWTALHWAARFGREKMVAALIASGASAGALTDPNSQDPKGKTPASIADTCGHKGLAGYLSEVALTSHFSSLTLEENELSKGSAALESEIALSSISKTILASNEDHLNLKDTFAAVRNAVQAAARIQAAFRSHSFRRRQEREAAAAAAAVDEYNILSSDTLGMSAASKLAFHSARDTITAALAIQKKYRGWKGRKGYLAFRDKVVKIQAHVRGYQVRKQYKIICWAVGILEKVVLRWRRRGVGLRGFRSEMESIDENEEEDILKVFRKENVEKAIDEAVTRVLSMVNSPDARQQYRRMLKRYRQAKAEKGAESDVISSHRDASYMENEDAG